MSDTTRTHPRWRTPIIVVSAIVVVLVGAFAAFAFWFLRDDAPDEVSIDAATAQVTDDTTGDTSATPTDAPTDSDEEGGDEEAISDTSSSDASAADADADSADASGTWNVDTSIGEFSYEDSTGTFVGFRIAEELASIGSTEAVGRTPEVTGTLVIDGTTITEVTIEADMSAITTNESRRDDNVQSALETGEFPTATFVLSEPIEIDAAALSGSAITVDATGDLTIHGVTQTVTIPLEAQLVDDTIVVVGSLDVTFADYGVEVPSSPMVVSVDDHGPLELQLFFTR